MAATALGNIPLSTAIYPSADVDAAISGLASGVSEEIAAAVSQAWKAGGSKAPSDLTSALLVAANDGKVYNMSADGTSTSDFVEGSGKSYIAGTDVAVINTGSASSPVYKFNILGTHDSSVVKSVNGYTPTNGAVTIPTAGVSGNGLMSSGDYAKLSGIAAGAEVNQNAFSKIAVSGVTGTGDAASKTDTLTLVPGSNVTMTRDGKSVTINATVPSVSYPVTDGIIAGGSSLLSGTTIVIPLATNSGTAGVVEIAGNVSSGGPGVVTAGQVSGAISGAVSGLVSGGTLHANLVSNGNGNPTGTIASGTIYSLIKAIHASDNTTES